MGPKMGTTSPEVILSADTHGLQPWERPRLAWEARSPVSRKFLSSLTSYRREGWGPRALSTESPADLGPCPGKVRKAVFESRLSRGLAPGRGLHVHKESCHPLVTQNFPVQETRQPGSQVGSPTPALHGALLES